MILIIFIIILALTLSLDAFSLAISLSNFFKSKDVVVESFLVGIMHFIFPLLGSILNKTFIANLNINASLFTMIIFLYIGMNILKDFKNESSNFKLTKFNMSVFAFSVSLDSFGVGLTLKPNFIYFLVFSVFSFVFTNLGLLIGKYTSKKLGKVSKILAIITIFGISFVNFIDFLLF